MSAQRVDEGRTALGIEFGSTRIKACLVDLDDPKTVLGVGAHEWENRLENGLWTYSLDEVWAGLQSAYADLVADIQHQHGVALKTVGSIGVSAMMHGYLAFDESGELLTPFRTWRNTNTTRAAAELIPLFEENIPLRWSIAHLHQAVLDGEPHVPDMDFLTSLAGYVHWQLTGEQVTGIADASGIFPIDAQTLDYRAGLAARYDEHVAGRGLRRPLLELLPRVLRAGEAAGTLSAAGAALLDPTGILQPGIPMCPPEGDGGTGMIATGALAPRSGNVSVGTSIFAMIVLDQPLQTVREEIDIIATPAGLPVAMVHCNNGASEFSEWVGLFARFAAAAGLSVAGDEVYRVLLAETRSAEPDADGLIAFNYLAGEPITGHEEGRPLFVRAADSSFTLANFIRSQLCGVFATLAIGMEILAEEQVEIDRLYAHGGVFRTAEIAQRQLAAALKVPVAVGNAAAEGGAWGMAVLAAYAQQAEKGELADYLSAGVFGDDEFVLTEPEEREVAGFARYLERYRAALPMQTIAVTALPGQ